MRHDHRAGIGEHAVSRNVIHVVVRVDDKPHGQLRPGANLGEQPRGGRGARERIDDGHAIVSDHESRVRPCRLRSLGVVNRGPDIRPDLRQRERRLW